MLPACALRLPRARGRLVAASTVLGTALSCGAPGHPNAPSGAECNAAAGRESEKVDLSAWDARSRAEVRRLLGLGVVAVRYERVGCRVSLELVPGCVGSANYAYTPYFAKDFVLLTSPEQAAIRLPLGAESLRQELEEEEAVRIDTVLAGQHALAPGQSVEGWDRPGCSRATHYARSIDVGGVARTSGDRDIIEWWAPSMFGMASGALHYAPVRWRTDGNPEVCRGAKEQRGEYIACSTPLGLELVEIRRGERKAAPAPPPWPPPDCPSDMAGIRGGSFMMGSDSGEADEKPAHSVQVDAFCMDTTEVTVDAYEQCVRAGRCKGATGTSRLCNYGKADRGKHPVNCVDWQQASDYCAWQDKKLPSEEQWEYAARGGAEGRLYPWGNMEPQAAEFCWSGPRRLDGTCEVGSTPAGAFGLSDMAGNVWEWTQTEYCDSYAESKRCREARVSRGGGWPDVNPLAFRASNRSWLGASQLSDAYGFRCVR